MIKEAIILAGGLGTRLRSAVPELPKCMAPVGGRPFIGYVTDYFRGQGIEHFIFALGYKSDYFDDFFAAAFPSGGYSVSLEQEPLGTGGAIRQACGLAKTDTALILNGDTFYHIALAELSAFHAGKDADCSLCLKPMRDFDRFGVVELDEEQRVSQFREKQHYAAGLINGGVYALNTGRFRALDLPEKFSFEKEYLEKGDHRLYGLVQDHYFIDIGIPEDYQRVQDEINQLL
ncbi:MAG: nucleotidyltransferase family protein [Bacteroidetes bacterium]|nr:nucleotidyltransferase family protein [Bacteroidota bacterium]